MKKVSPDYVDIFNRRLRQDNKQSKYESGYRRNVKKTKRLKFRPHLVEKDH